MSKSAKRYPFKKGRRLRIFAGPNGSGKTTIFQLIDDLYDTGYVVNPDEIATLFEENGFVRLSSFGINSATRESFDSYLKSSSLVKKARIQYDINLAFEKDKIVNKSPATISYEPAIVAEFMRDQLLKEGRKFSYETVMSHYSKVEFIEEASKRGYKTYLYFVCLDHPEMNVIRVENRVKR